jgi:hypothetical protein
MFTKKIAPKTPVDADLGGAPGGLPKKSFSFKKGSSKSGGGFSKRSGLRGGKR